MFIRVPMDIFEDFLEVFPHSIHPRRRFYAKFRVRSVASLGNKEHLETGGRILMPPSSVQALSELYIANPWIFCLTNPKNGLRTHCGVLEFTADEGRVYVPTQFMTNLQLLAGQIVELYSVSLPDARFAKFQPQSVDFLNITNPRAILEKALRSYACLTVGDIISISYGEKIYMLKIVSLGEGIEAARTIDCDVEVDFEPPVGYVEETPITRQEKLLEESAQKVEELIQQAISDQSESVEDKKFRGEPARIDGKKVKKQAPQPGSERQIGIPDYNFQIGSLFYIRKNLKDDSGLIEFSQVKGDPFDGQGRKLREKKYVQE